VSYVRKDNEYRLVHKVFKLAKENERKDRDPYENEKEQLYKTINKPKETPKYVLEAYKEITKKKKVENEKNDNK
jgi:hypothetical protein